jgi:pimeloyl-ACP methyl ester carboxylesterase
MESQFLNDMKLMQAHTIHEVSCGKGHVSWHEYGDAKSEGAPLILLHGGHGSWEHWYHNVEELSEHFHVFVPDMPGFGNSSFFDSQLQDGMISPLVSTIDNLIGKDKQIQIAGFSFGGFVAAHLANQRPGVTKLALLGSAGHGGPRRPRGELLAWKEFYASGHQQELQQVMRENLYLQMLSSYDRIDPLAIRIHQDACVATRFRSRPIARPGGLAEQLEAYAEPVLMIWGEHDITCTPEYLVEKLVSEKRHRSAEIILDAGHWVQYEKPEQVNSLLVQWFK